MMRPIQQLILLATTFGSLTSAFSAEQVAPDSISDYELRGFFGAVGDIDISLRNTHTDKSGWYHLGEKTGGVLVEKADSKTGTATIVVSGIRRTLRIAAEAAQETNDEKRAKHLRYTKALMDYFSQWGKGDDASYRRILDAIGKSAGEAGITLLKNHPEYFHTEGCDTPEAKTAMMNVMKQALLAASNTPTKDGGIPSQPANFDAMIEDVYGDISISIDGAVEKRNNFDEYPEMFVNGHTTIMVTTLPNNNINEKANVGEVFMGLETTVNEARKLDLEIAQRLSLSSSQSS